MLFWLTMVLTLITFAIFAVFCCKHDEWKKRYNKADAKLDYDSTPWLTPRRESVFAARASSRL